jgi:CheY-like chemotaxis protein
MAKKKILIVDDERDVLAVLEERLSKAGYEVIEADSGQSAIIKAKNEKPNLILLDIIMPGMDGQEVAQKLKSDIETKDIPVIFLTCLFTKEEEAKLGHGVADNFFIAKPYDSSELISEIKKHIT